MENQLTKHFSLSELISSKVATINGIKNTPDDEVEANLAHLAKNLLQPLRDRYGKPLTINSGYRSPALNRAVGGVSTSQHLKGEAADVACKDPKLLLALLKNSRLTFDQAILYPTFLHFSLKRVGMNRRQIIVKTLLAFILMTTSCAKPIYLQGKTEYIEKITIRDTTIYIELEQSKQAVISPDSSRLENQTAISIARIDTAGLLHHSLEQKKQSIQKKIEYKERVIIKRDSIPYPQIVKEVKVVTKIPKIFWGALWIAIASIVTIIYKVTKKIK